MAGLFRIRCLNSLVAQTGTIDSVKVRHSGDVGAKVIEGTYRVLKEAEKTLAAPADWGALNLNRDERIILIPAAGEYFSIFLLYQKFLRQNPMLQLELSFA